MRTVSNLFDGDVAWLLGHGIEGKSPGSTGVTTDVAEALEPGEHKRASWRSSTTRSANGIVSQSGRRGQSCRKRRSSEVPT